MTPATATTTAPSGLPADADRLDRLAMSVDRVAALLERLVELHETPRRVEVEALDASEAARLCGVGRTSWLQLNAEALCPSPISLGPRCPRWSKQELLAWLRNGAPPRNRWAAMRDLALRRTG